MTQRYERSRKSSHLDTVYYEIDMMEYAYEQLVKGEVRSLPENNMLIESYLIHYRNLIEFFSGSKHRDRPRGKARDISAKDAKAWGGRSLTREEVDVVVNPSKNLVDLYFEDISQFLQHCTERRFLESRDWDLQTMHTQIGHIVAAFAAAFPRPHSQGYGLTPENSRSNSATCSSTTTTFVLTTSKLKTDS